MKILNKNGISDAANWLYVSTVTTDGKGNYHSSKNDAPIRCMVVVNKTTGERLSIPLN